MKVFARADNDTPSLVYINESLDNTLLLLHNQYKENIVIRKEYENIPEITCYRGKINQVFVNVVSNAIQAIEGAGSVVISTAVASHKGKEYIEVKVSDTGKGISERDKTRIFEPFFTTKDVGKGTGLGLSISHGIIQSHSGFIEVDSKEGEGTTMKIYIPVVFVNETVA